MSYLQLRLSLSLIKIVVFGLIFAMSLKAEEPTNAYVYTPGSVIDAVTGKGVPGVPVSVTINYRKVKYWSTGYTETYYITKTQNVYTNISGQYQAVDYMNNTYYIEDPNGLPIRVVETYYGWVSSSETTNDLTTTSSSGSTIYVRPTNRYMNYISIPVSFVNAQISHGYNQLSQFMHTVNSGLYSLTCTEPTVSFSQGSGSGGSVVFTFSLTGKYNNVSIGSATATITATPVLKETNNGLSFAMDWTISNLSLTGFSNNSTHLTAVKNIINGSSGLTHTLYLAPAALSVTPVSLASPIDITIWNEISLSSFTMTSSAISLGIESGWYVAKTLGYVGPIGGGTGGGGGGGPIDDEPIQHKDSEKVR